MRERTLDAGSESPLYRQLMAHLRSDIGAGVYPQGSKIPSEQELGQTYQVSRVTVRKALAELSEEGLLKRCQGKGTFVSAPLLCRDLRDNVRSFHESCASMGFTADTRVISARVQEASAADKSRLQAREKQVVCLRRLRLASGLPVMLEENHFPMAYAWLLDEDLTGSLYHLLAERGVEPKRGLHEISLCYATGEAARLLRVEEGAALLQLCEVIYDQHGGILHTSWQLIRGDRFTFRI